LPIYEYRCTKCFLDFDVKRSFGEDSSGPCPRCQGESLRVFSPVPIIFKGSGFYITDNRSEEKSDPGEEKEGSSPVTPGKSNED
jgi:putative FmdB family regulatory protein